MTRNTLSTCGDAVCLRHTLVTLSSCHVLSALTLAALLMTNLRHGAVSVTLAGLAVFRCDGVSKVTFSTTVACRTAVTLATAQTLACDWVTAARCGQVQVTMATAGLARASRYSGLAVISVGTSITAGSRVSRLTLVTQQLSLTPQVAGWAEAVVVDGTRLLFWFQLSRTLSERGQREDEGEEENMGYRH